MARKANKPLIYVYHIYDEHDEVVDTGLVRALSRARVAEWLRPIDVTPATAEDVACMMSCGDQIRELDSGDGEP